ncbi:MAG: hypothetical protein LBT09_12385 [Planctomycetaceae bacterium]|nr:hypothetical protein [Planctomycetaceae bacterium]
MKRNLQKMSYRQIVILVGIFVLSFGLFFNQLQQTQAAPSQTNQSHTRCKEHNLKSCNLCAVGNPNAEMHYELVPHVVLPETIEYNHSAPKSGNTNAHAITASPFVATYTAFPSYNLPANTGFRQINQLVYPITPKTLPMPLPQKNSKKDTDNKRNEKRSVETQLEKNQLEKDQIEKQIDPFLEQPSNKTLSKTVSNKTQKSDNNRTDNYSVADEMFDLSMAILQVSGTEEVVPATPRFALNEDVTQTGIFCNSAPKQPVAWSFSSPIFKVAAVPTGHGNNGYISQFNPHGGVNIGFQPTHNGQPQPQFGNYPPNFAQNNFAQNNGANVQVLPNGMLLLSVPPSHHNCGLLRCRDHNWRYMLLPPSANQIPNLPPQPAVQPQLPAPNPPTAMIDPQTQALMYPHQSLVNPYANPYPQQPQIMPITAMTPYGMAVVGYRQIPTPQMNFGIHGQTGNFMNVAYNQPGQQFSHVQLQLAQQQLAQQQLIQQQLLQQQLAQQKQQLSANQNNTETQIKNTTDKDNNDESSELKTPLPINGTANGTVAGNASIQDTGQMGLYANPYAMYALQSGNLTAGANNNGVGEAGKGISGEQSVGISTAHSNPQFNILSNPYASNYPMAMLPQQFGMYGSPYGFNPYSTPIYPAAQFGGQFVNQQFMPPFGQPYLNAGYMPVNFQQPTPQQQMNQGNGNGLSMSDVLLLMMLMKENNKPQRRLTFFERIAERRAARRQRAEQNDPFNQIMQMWSAPFYADSTARMPASNAYPYGYFGAQPAPINTANYGGYHNLYYGNTTYY